MRRILESITKLSSVMDRAKNGSDFNQPSKNGFLHKKHEDRTEKRSHTNAGTYGEEASSFEKQSGDMPEAAGWVKNSEYANGSERQATNGVERRLQEFRFAYQKAAQQEQLLRNTKNSQNVQTKPVKKVAIHIKLDEDIIAHFKKDGPGYQTRINQFLRQVLLP